MAALNRPTQATYTLHEEVTIDTHDNEDHTFCGIMFPVKCKDLLPLEHIVIKSVSIRGGLGPLTVWVSNEDSSRPSNNGEHRVRLRKQFWTKLYEKTHKPSRRTYKQLDLDQPIKLKPGETKVIYIHSTLQSDDAIVYDNSYYGMSAKRHEDDKLAIMTGRAHVSPTVFGQDPIWGWGNAWRDRREFVGRLDYGTVYKLWNPQVQPKFGSNFQDGARCLSMCQRRWESPVSILPDECIYYILNMCRWDWFDDDSGNMKERRQREKARVRADQRAAALRQESEEAVASARWNTEDEDRKPSPCNKANMETDDEEDDDEYHMDQDSSDEEEGEEDEGDEDDDSDSDAWSDNDDGYHRANIQAFSFHAMDSDDEGDGEEEFNSAERSRRDWVRRQFARIHTLRYLASMED